MKANIVYDEQEYRKADKYLRLVQGGRNHQELVTPDVIYKLSLMALDRITTNFLFFCGELPENLGTVGLLYRAQKIVYIDDALIEELAEVIRVHDQNIRGNRLFAAGITRSDALTVWAHVKKVQAILTPYLP